MRIRAKANGNVIEAHDDAAKELIAAGIYEATDEPLSSETAVKPMTTEDFPKEKAGASAGQAKRRKSQK